MSVRKPGVSSSAPPSRTSAPSLTSRAGGRCSCSASRKRLPGTSALAAHQSGPEQRLGEQQDQCQPPADHVGDLHDRPDLRERDHNECDDAQRPHQDLLATR